MNMLYRFELTHIWQEYKLLSHRHAQTFEQFASLLKHYYLDKAMTEREKTRRYFRVSDCLQIFCMFCEIVNSR